MADSMYPINSIGLWSEVFWIMGFLDRPYWEIDPLTQYRIPKYEYFSKDRDFEFDSRNKSIFEFKSRNKSDFKWVVKNEHI